MVRVVCACADGATQRRDPQRVMIYDSPPSLLVRVGGMLLSLKATVAVTGAVYFAYREVATLLASVGSSSSSASGGGAVDWAAVWSGTLPGVALPVSRCRTALNVLLVGFLL